MGKIKLAFYGDAPMIATGFGCVSRAILGGLHKTGKYEISVFGINHHGLPYDRQKYPYDIWPAALGSNDPYGRQKAFNWLVDQNFDVLLMNQDSFILGSFMNTALPKLRQLKDFVSIAYFPIDGRPKVSWVETMDLFDIPVTYTQFARNVLDIVYPQISDKLKVIPHGVDVKTFYPLSDVETDKFRKEYFGKFADRFIVTVVNRNQPRKDIPRAILAFKEFQRHCPDAILYLNMSAVDVGWNLVEVIKSFGLTLNRDVILPHNKFDPSTGIDIKTLNGVYNASDVTISTTLGEGWGLSLVESMACKTPVIYPRNTACEEIVGVDEQRGYLVPSGKTINDYTILPNDNEVVRPLTSIEDLVGKLVYVYNNREEANEKAETAYKWITSNLVWDKHIIPIWDQLITKAIKNKPKEVIGNIKAIEV